MGFRLLTVARTLVDLTDVLESDRMLRAIREADFLGLLDVDALSAAVERAHGHANDSACSARQWRRIGQARSSEASSNTASSSSCA